MGGEAALEVHAGAPGVLLPPHPAADRRRLLSPDESPDLLILAAGAGRRFRGLKQLAPIGPGGEALLEYSAFDARRAGFGRVLLVVRAETEPEFRRRLGRGMARRVEVRYVHQRLGDLPGDAQPPPSRAKPWGTGHAVLAAAAAIDRPFAVINADDFYGAGSFARLARFFARRQGESVLAVMGFRVEDTLTDSGPVSRAVLELDAAGRLRRAVELPEVWRDSGRILARDDQGETRRLAGGEPVSMNMWGLTPAILAALESRFEEFLRRESDPAEAEFRLPEAIESLVGEGRFRVEVLPEAGPWCGLTYRQDRARASATVGALIERGEYPPELWG